MTDYIDNQTNLDLEVDEDEQAWQNLMQEIYADESVVDKSTYTRQELDEIAETMIANVGVNKELATALEALVPGAVTNARLIASFSHEFTKTNYKVTLEDIDKVKKGLMIAGSVGIVAIIIKIVLWLRDKFRKIFGKNTSDIKSQIDETKARAEKQAANYKAMIHEMEGKIKAGKAKEVIAQFNASIEQLGTGSGFTIPTGANNAEAMLKSWDGELYKGALKPAWNKHMVECERGLPKYLVETVKILVNHAPTLVEGIKQFKADMREDKTLAPETYRADWTDSKKALGLFDSKFQGDVDDGQRALFSNEFKKMLSTVTSECNSKTLDGLPPKDSIIGMTFGLNDFPADPSKLLRLFDDTPAVLTAINEGIKSIPEQHQKNRKILLAILADDWHVIVFAAQTIAMSYKAHVKLFDAVEKACSGALKIRDQV